MKTKIISLITACALLMGGLSSCSDELDIKQKGVYDTNTYYSTDEEADTGLALAMACLNNLVFNLVCDINCLSDDVWKGGPNAGDQPDLMQFNTFNISTENGKVEGLYAGLYQLIYFSNVLIEALEAKDAADLTPHMAQLIEEAYFLRGYAEFYLATFYGTAPVVQHVLQPAEYHPSNSQPGEMLQASIDDFRHAASSGLLPVKRSLGDIANLAHVTQAAADAFLGKALMFQKNYSEALTQFEKVIKTHNYALWEGPYENILKAESNWSDEGIFEINCPAGQSDATAPALMSYVYIYSGWRFSDTWDGTSINKPDDFLMDGYGFFNPQNGLLEAAMQCDGVTAANYDQSYRPASIAKSTNYVRTEMNITRLNMNAHGHGNYFGWKNRWVYSDIALDWGGWSPFPANNFRLMRYAEVLLSAAECQFQAGQGDKGLAYVNEVRQRAKAPAHTSIDLDKIKLERRVELCMEGQRFMDLVRWGDAAKVLGTQGQNIETIDLNFQLIKDPASNPNYGFKAGRNELLPFPKKEIDQNPNITQNPGY